MARSTDDGVSFAHQGIVYTGSTGTTDPFPLMFDASGTIRLFLAGPAGSPNVTSVTATDGTGLHFAPALDAGFRVRAHSEPGALKIGSTFFLYTGGRYFTSPDALNFGPLGGLATNGAGDAPSAVDAGDGTYLASYNCSSLVVCIASSTDGINWSQTSQVGAGSVPGLVKAPSRTLRIYVPGQ